MEAMAPASLPKVIRHRHRHRHRHRFIGEMTGSLGTSYVGQLF